MVKAGVSVLFLSYSTTTLSYSSLLRESQTPVRELQKTTGKPKTGPEGCDCHLLVTSGLDHWLLDPDWTPWRGSEDSFSRGLL